MRFYELLINYYLLFTSDFSIYFDIWQNLHKSVEKKSNMTELNVLSYVSNATVFFSAFIVLDHS